jgi:hypothetical protein
VVVVDSSFSPLFFVVVFVSNIPKRLFFFFFFFFLPISNSTFHFFFFRIFSVVVVVVVVAGLGFPAGDDVIKTIDCHTVTTRTPPPAIFKKMNVRKERKRRRRRRKINKKREERRKERKETRLTLFHSVVVVVITLRIRFFLLLFFSFRVMRFSFAAQVSFTWRGHHHRTAIQQQQPNNADMAEEVESLTSRLLLSLLFLSIPLQFSLRDRQTDGRTDGRSMRERKHLQTAENVETGPRNVCGVMMLRYASPPLLSSTFTTFLRSLFRISLERDGWMKRNQRRDNKRKRISPI